MVLGRGGPQRELNMQYQVNGLADEFTANIRKQPMKITLPADLPEQSVRKIFEYGLQRILNDASAGAKDEAEALVFAAKRWDSLVAGVIRQTRVVTGDPVAREAMKIAIAKVQAAPKFKAWAQENQLKPADKAYTEQLRELAKPLAAREDIMARAKANVDAAAAIEVDIDI
jgi:hypothetical protein